MPKPAFFKVLCLLLLTGTPALGQSLYDVVASLSDRQRVVNQRAQVQRHLYNQEHSPDLPVPADTPIDWLEVGTNPGQSAVDGLGIGERIALLNQAVQEFERLKFEFLNTDGGVMSTGTTVGTLRHYGESDFDPLPRATPGNYHQLLAALAHRVSSLRLVPWVAGFKEITQTHSTIAWENYGYEDGEPYVELAQDDLPTTFDWKPTSMGSDGFYTEHTSTGVYALPETDARAHGAGKY